MPRNRRRLMRFSRASTEPVGPRGRIVGALLGALLGMAAILPGSAVAQSSVTIRSGLHDGYGRLVFDWPKPVRFEASLTDSQLVLRFNQALSADLSNAAIKRLDGYLAPSVLAADPRRVTFDVVKPIPVRSFVNARP